MFRVVWDWVDLKLSLARYLRRMALFLSARMSLLPFLDQNMLRAYWLMG